MALSAQQTGRILEETASASHALDDITDSVKAAATLYTSAYLLAPKITNARTLNRLGLIRFNEGKYRESAVILSKAVERAKTSEDKYLNKTLVRKIVLNRDRAAAQVNQQSLGFAVLPASIRYDLNSQ